MSDLKSFSKYELSAISKRDVWRNSLYMGESNKNEENRNNTKYKLHATGYADVMNGRTYVALPEDLKITDEIKKKYNLM